MSDTFIAVFANYAIILPVILVIIVLIKQPRGSRLRFAASVMLSGIAALIIAYIAGKLYYNPRPFVVEHFTPLIAHTNSNGFPSDHTLLAASLGFSALLVSRTFGIGILLLAIAIGTARVLAGVHHPLDVAASLAIAGITSLLMGWLVRRVWVKFDMDRPTLKL